MEFGIFVDIFLRCSCLLRYFRMFSVSSSTPSKPHSHFGLYNQEKKPPPAFLTPSAAEEITLLGHKTREFCLQWKQKGAKNLGKDNALAM